MHPIKVLSYIFIIIFVGGFIFFRSWHQIINYKNRKAGKRYCEENDLTFIKAKNYELHSRLYFEKYGVKSWANYDTDRNYNITWKKETPLEKIAKKLSNKN
ncbi:hypothetical protein U0L90_12040 [Flavobacteriaceae sp. LMIT009]